MPLPDAKPDRRIYELLKTTDLQSLTFSDFQKVAQTIYAEQGAEDELRRIVLVNLARLSVAGEWTGLTSAGSSSSFNAEITNADDINSPYNLNRIDATPPFGMNTGNLSVSSRDEPMFFPFIAPESSSVAGIVIEIVSAAGSACNGVVAIYSDASGVPKGKISADATFDATSTGQVEQTSIGSVSLTRGTQYWIGFTRSAAVSFTWRCGSSTYAWNGPTENLSSGWTILWIPSGSNNTLPASVTSTDLEPRGFPKISVGLNQ